MAKNTDIDNRYASGRCVEHDEVLKSFTKLNKLVESLYHKFQLDPDDIYGGMIARKKFEDGLTIYDCYDS